jgi:hypothetical protein
LKIPPATFGAEIKKILIFMVEPNNSYLMAKTQLAYAQSMLTAILEGKKVFRLLWGPFECVKIAFSIFHFFT